MGQLDGMVSILLAALFLTAGCGGTSDPGHEEPVPEAGAAVVLKGDLPGGEVQVLGVATDGDGIHTVTFSDGSTVSFDGSNHALVTVGSDDFLYVNGHRSANKYIGIPYYTVGADGFWYKDGVATTSRATPANFDAPEGVIYLTNVLVGPRRYRFQFSDGTFRDIPRRREVRLFVEKTPSRLGIRVGTGRDGDYLYYPFSHRFKAYQEDAYPSFLDNWGIGAVELHRYDGSRFTRTAALFLPGEAELAVQVPRAGDPATDTYVGGTLHGFEQIAAPEGARALTVAIDGQPVGEEEAFDLREASRVEMTQRSLLYQAYSDTEPWAEVFRRWRFEDGDLHIAIDLTLRRDMPIRQAQFGMLCVLRRWEGSTANNYLTRYAVKDSSPYQIFDISDGWQNGSPLTRADFSAGRITEYGERGLSFALVVDEADRKPGGGMFCGTNGNAYNKIYFDLTGAYEAKAGETLHADVHWEIDTIR